MSKTAHTAQWAHRVNLTANNSNQIAKTLVNEKYPLKLKYRTLDVLYTRGSEMIKKNVRRNNLANVKHWLPSPVSDPFKNNVF